MKKLMYTVGHSNLDLDEFLKLIEKHQVQAIADVRSFPYSQRYPQYNKENLKKTLKDHSIEYVFLGEELGARSDDPLCYEDDLAVYEKIADTKLFKQGIERLEKGGAKFNVCMMCAEKEPLDCHRAILVSRHVNENKFDINHILNDGQIENHKDTIQRLIGKSANQEDLFDGEDVKIERAYYKRGQEIGYRKNNKDKK